MITFDKISPELYNKLNRVRFFVEANSYEQHQLWIDYAQERPDITPINWNTENKSFSLTLDHIKIKKKEWPVVVNFSFATLNDIYVCFHNATSMVVHHGMIDDFLHTNFPVKYDRSAYYTDASNFHSVYHYCTEERNKRYKLAKM